MWMQSFIILVFITALVRSQDCDFEALNNCTQPVVIPVALGLKLMQSDIIQSRSDLCGAMNRDQFEKLASCAHNDPACNKAIFRTPDTDPYNITGESGFIATLKNEFAESEPNRIKLMYDIVCDDSCVQFLSSTGSSDSDNDNQGVCGDETTDVEDEEKRLLGLKNETDVTKLDVKNYCNLQVKNYKCNLEHSLGEMPSCKSLVNAMDTAKIEQAFLTKDIQQNPLLSKCDRFAKTVLDEIFTMDTSSAGRVKFSSLMIAALVGLLFFLF